jgi:hypothetical protein
MSWDIHTRRRPRADDHTAHVKASWGALGTIDDVTLDGASGVRCTSEDVPVRRSMNAFSKPIEADFRWEDDVESPEVVVRWTDGGEVCQERVALKPHSHHLSLPAAVTRPFHRGHRESA